MTSIYGVYRDSASRWITVPTMVTAETYYRPTLRWWSATTTPTSDRYPMWRIQTSATTTQTMTATETSGWQFWWDPADDDDATSWTVTPSALAAPNIIVRRASRHREWLIRETATRAEETAELRARAAEQRRIAEAASQRAEQLLLSHLTPEQRRTFEQNKWFVVEGGKSKRKYRIRNSGSLVANIDVLDGDKVAHRLCGHVNSRASVPLADHLLAQKVMLELAEDDFLRLANRHG